MWRNLLERSYQFAQKWTSPDLLRRMWPRPRSLGERGEDAAARFLRRRGYRLVARRHRLAWGELDLVAVDGRTIVFVEVKTRRTHDSGSPAEAVSPTKQRQIGRLALGFLKFHGLLEYPTRFDVVAITWPAGARRPSVSHLVDAFRPPGVGGLYG